MPSIKKLFACSLLGCALAPLDGCGGSCDSNDMQCPQLTILSVTPRLSRAAGNLIKFSLAERVNSKLSTTLTASCMGGSHSLTRTPDADPVMDGSHFNFAVTGLDFQDCPPGMMTFTVKTVETQDALSRVGTKLISLYAPPVYAAATTLTTANPDNDAQGVFASGANIFIPTHSVGQANVSVALAAYDRAKMTFTASVSYENQNPQTKFAAGRTHAVFYLPAKPPKTEGLLGVYRVDGTAKLERQVIRPGDGMLLATDEDGSYFAVVSPTRITLFSSGLKASSEAAQPIGSCAVAADSCPGSTSRTGVTPVALALSSKYPGLSLRAIVINKDSAGRYCATVCDGSMPDQMMAEKVEENAAQTSCLSEQLFGKPSSVLPQTIAIADLDSDQLADLVFLPSGKADRLYWAPSLTSSAPCQFGAPEQVGLPAIPSPMIPMSIQNAVGIAAADINGDGPADFAVASQIGPAAMSGGAALFFNQRPRP